MSQTFVQTSELIKQTAFTRTVTKKPLTGPQILVFAGWKEPPYHFAAHHSELTHHVS